MSFVHLRLRSEYSFRRAFGRVTNVAKAAARNGATTAALADTGTWGHVAWAKACKAAGMVPIYGAEVLFVPDAAHKAKDAKHGHYITLLAKTTAGLRNMYELLSLAANPDHFYYVPRLDWSDLERDAGAGLFVLIGPGLDIKRLKALQADGVLMVAPGDPISWVHECAKQKQFPVVVVADNYGVRPGDNLLLDVVNGTGYAPQRVLERTAIAHIPTADELRLALPQALPAWFSNTTTIAAQCMAALPQASMVDYHDASADLRTMCIAGAKERGVWPLNAEYKARLKRELDLIKEKKFEHYFYVIADMVRAAKQEMLVGPARGSSAGSLVCYLIGITDVDPIVHSLMFERFIDITRADLPDIDIDFPDELRERVFTYLQSRYGNDRVGRLGTINRYKAKSALNDMAHALHIPLWKLKDVSGAMIERSTGDARAQMCLADTFASMEAAQKLADEYPSLVRASELEGHARHAGTHAAGYVITQEPITNYASVDRSGTMQVDKYDAESLGILKIDVLGLRTLTVLQECLEMIGHPHAWLLALPLDNADAFKLFNEERFAGIFQFEGYALQSLTRQMGIQNFNDIVAVTTLARPGPLHSGGAGEFIQRRIGNDPVVHLHASAQPYTEESYGVVIYQEQVMAVGRALGGLSWEEVSALRKAMSKSLGEEFFNHYWERFKVGAKQLHGVPENEARAIWEKLCTFGSWAFNKSHAVSYALLSYWCAYLKAEHPLQYAAACLRHAKDDEQATQMLRELVREGYQFKPVDAMHSDLNWTVVDGTLLGGLMNVKGIGPSIAADIIVRRSAGKEFTKRQQSLLENPITPFNNIFEAHERFKDVYARPKRYNVLSGPVVDINTIQQPGTYIFIGKVMEKNLRDLNEYGNLVKRGGKKVDKNPLFLNLVLQDDTGKIIATIGRFKYKLLGQPLLEKAHPGDWYLWKGTIKNDWRMVHIESWRRIHEGIKPKEAK